MMTQAAALTRAAHQFRLYEGLHRGKGTAAGTEKAEVNRQFAEMCDEVRLSRPYQARVLAWHLECFGFDAHHDKVERGDRMLEEVLELLQTAGYDFGRIQMLADYVAARPAGQMEQEVGGVLLTTAAFCGAHDLDMGDCAEKELDRVTAPGVLEKIRAKQAAKPRGGPLPE